MQESIHHLLTRITNTLIQVYNNHEVAEHNAWWLIEKLLQTRRANLLASSALELSAAQEQQLQDWLQKMTVQHMPLQYILGNVPFLDITLKVEPPVIIPRPETEYWCGVLIEQLHQCLALPANFQILDLCSGSGCIALALGKAFPAAHIYAVDIADNALALAHTNSLINAITNVGWIKSDLYTKIPTTLQFDLIVSNPPYIDPQDWQHLDQTVTQWEDKQGLVAQDHGYAIIEQIIQGAITKLKQSFIATPENSAIAKLSKPSKKFTHFPQLWIEIGIIQGPRVRDMMLAYGFSNAAIVHDLTGRPRVVIGML